jgi:glutamate racemase
VIRYAIGCVDRLLDKGPIDALVIACNTASAHGLSALREHLGTKLPVIGVVGPGAETVVRASTTGPIGVLATNSTIQSGRYQDLIRALSPEATVVAVAAPLLVPLAEEGFVSGPVVNSVLDHHLSDLYEAQIESLVLGCTHYPILRDAIDRWFQERGLPVKIVDSAEATARAVVERLPTEDTRGQNELHVMVTDVAPRFTDIAHRFLGEEIELELVDL